MTIRLRSKYFIISLAVWIISVNMPAFSGEVLSLSPSKAEDEFREGLLAYEAGYRIQSTKRLSFDSATFYNVYDGIINDVRDETFENVYDGETYGIETPLIGTFSIGGGLQVGTRISTKTFLVPASLLFLRMTPIISLTSVPCSLW